MAFQKKICQEQGCNSPVWSKGKCKYHGSVNKGLKRKSSSFGKQKISKNGIKMHDFFQQIWDNTPKPVRCFETNEIIPYPSTYNFAHILPKSSFEEYAFEEWNIKIVTYEVHTNYDQKNYEKTPKLSAYAQEIRHKILIN